MAFIGSFLQACAKLLVHTSGSSFQQLLQTLQHLAGLAILEFPRTG